MGFKFWMCCDSIGYSYKTLVYEGAKYRDGKKVTTHKLGENVVNDLISSYKSKGHIVITDNYCSTIDLSSELLEEDTYLIG